MGGNGSASRKVSFGLDEEEKVTVIEGVKVTLLTKFAAKVYYNVIRRETG